MAHWFWTRICVWIEKNTGGVVTYFDGFDYGVLGQLGVMRSKLWLYLKVSCIWECLNCCLEWLIAVTIVLKSPFEWYMQHSFDLFFVDLNHYFVFFIMNLVPIHDLVIYNHNSLNILWEHFLMVVFSLILNTFAGVGYII